MSLVGFKAQNHTQQVSRRGADDEVDDRGTLPEHFAAFDAIYGPFTLDAAAAPHNAKCERYFTRSDDGLVQSWAGERVWCNPPYSDCGAWVRKAWDELDGTLGITLLLPANRVEQKWWQELVEPHRDKANGRLRVRFLGGRMRFDRPGVVVGPKGDRPPFGVCLLIFKPKANLTLVANASGLPDLMELGEGICGRSPSVTDTGETYGAVTGGNGRSPLPCPTCSLPTWDGIHATGHRACYMNEVPGV